MQALWLDYQRPYPGRRRIGLLLLGAGLAATGLLVVEYFSIVASRDDMQEQVLQLQREASRERLLTGSASSHPSAAAQKRGAVAIDGATVGHSAAQWEALFASLEAAGDDSVTLLTLQPGGSEITIGGEAKSLAASLDYVKRLQLATAFVNAHLTQTEVVVEHPQRPVRFTLAAEWRA